jgi:hypothetical protein
MKPNAARAASEVLVRAEIDPMQTRLSALCLPALLAVFALAGCASLATPPAATPSPSTPTTSVPAKPVSTFSRSEGEAEFDRLIARQDRVYRVIAPLIVKNAVLCKTASRRGKGDELRVVQVLEGSGAQRAGVQRGDALLSIAGKNLPLGPQAETETARLLAPLLKQTTEVDVQVLRNEAPITLKVALTTACAFTVDIGNAPHVNAYSDGRRIMVTAGLLAEVSDQELAVILAREIAHNVQLHATTMQTRATMASIIDTLLPPKPDLSGFAGNAGLKTMDEKLDQEADRIALYMLARAGLNPTVAVDTLERFARRYPATVLNSYTALHPWTEDRKRQMVDTIAEIRKRQASKKSLVP